MIAIHHNNFPLSPKVRLQLQFTNKLPITIAIMATRQFSAYYDDNYDDDYDETYIYHVIIASA